ncbi:hypothetical protein [Alloalcanivorax mobilis]|uniref:hypothetical protein n=1 Tax=Alloalcanivorax mobilis TaxID=2019569 RepID=UPI000C763900|nr:hypothetical protein [Alloalcanivorax mobilis]
MIVPKMFFYTMASIIIMSSAYEKDGAGSLILWLSGALGALVAAMYFWEWREPEEFDKYINENMDCRAVGVKAFWLAIFFGVIFVLSGGA